MKIIFEDPSELLTICNFQLVKCKIIIDAYEQAAQEYVRVKKAEYKLKSWWYRMFVQNEQQYIHTVNFDVFCSAVVNNLNLNHTIIKSIIEKCIPLVAEGAKTVILDDCEVGAISKMIMRDENCSVKQLKEDFKTYLHIIV